MDLFGFAITVIWANPEAPRVPTPHSVDRKFQCSICGKFYEAYQIAQHAGACKNGKGKLLTIPTQLPHKHLQRRHLQIWLNVQSVLFFFDFDNIEQHCTTCQPEGVPFYFAAKSMPCFLPGAVPQVAHTAKHQTTKPRMGVRA